ncbi:MAG: hypothetical protein R3C14_35785 [Caldilineaceae bacterium]
MQGRRYKEISNPEGRTKIYNVLERWHLSKHADNDEDLAKLQEEKERQKKQEEEARRSRKNRYSVAALWSDGNFTAEDNVEGCDDGDIESL